MMTIRAFPPEEEQLRLLEEADAYYLQRVHGTERAVELYENVLEMVDLAEPVRLDVMYRLGELHGIAGDGSENSAVHFRRSVEYFDALIEDYESKKLMDSRFLDIHFLLANVENLAGHSDRAEGHLMYIRTLDLELPDDQRKPFAINLSAAGDNAMHLLIGIHQERGADGIAGLRSLRSRVGVDEEFGVLIDIAIEGQLATTEADLTGRIVAELQQASPAVPSTPDDKGDVIALDSLDAAALDYLGRPRGEDAQATPAGLKTADAGGVGPPNGTQDEETEAPDSRVVTVLAVAAIVAVPAIAFFVYRLHSRNAGGRRL